MDYVLGSVAALVTGNVTPNRPKLMKRALTPTKHQSSPNVTPKSEFVDDRSIFLSPSMQKKKAIVKKSPKRIFQNPELESTENAEGNLSLTSPKADKVKKHLKDELEADSVANQSRSSQKSPKNKGNNKRVSTSTQDSNKSVNEQNVNESSLNKKKTKQNSESDKTESGATQPAVNVSPKDASAVAKSPKKRKQRRKSVVNTDKENNTSAKLIKSTPSKCLKNQDNTSNSSEAEKNNDATETSNTNTPKKKNRKRRKKSKAPAALLNPENKDKESDGTDKENIKNENQVATKKKNKKHKKSKGPQSKPEVMDTDEQKPAESEKKEAEPVNEEVESENEEAESVNEEEESENEEAESENEEEESENEEAESENEEAESENEEAESENEEAESENEEEEKSNFKSTVNPNAVTDKESDSEHESDDEIVSENEEINKKVLESEKPEESSDDENEETQKVEKKEVDKKEGGEERMTEEEIKRTLFVGNVPFSVKCKKELKKIFSKHGQIETIRIRTVPIMDGRYTAKLAVIKNELHPERTTVNVYIKYADEESVENALVENNTILNENHLRVSRSSSTGAEHDPKCSVFIGNLPFAMEDEALRAKFENCGEIHSVRIVRDKKTNAGKGFGYVNFESKDGVELALALTEEDLTVKNRILRVKRCTLTTTKKKPIKTNNGQKHSGYKGGNHQPNQKSSGFRGGFNQGGQQRGDFRSGSNENNQQRVGFRPGNNQGGQERGGFRPGNNQGGQERGGFRPGNYQGGQQRGGFRPGDSQGGQQRGGFRTGNNQGGQQRGGFRPGNNQGGQQRSGPPSRNNQGNRQRAFGNNQERGGFNKNFSGQRNLPQKDEQGREGAHRRVMNKRKSQESAGGDAPPNKKQKDMNEPNREKKTRKEYVGITAEKKKKHKFDKGQKKKKALSEILTK